MKQHPVLQEPGQKSLEGQGSDKWRNSQTADKTVLLCGIAGVPFQQGNPVQQPKMQGHRHRIAQRNGAEFCLSDLAAQADVGLKTPWAVLRTVCVHLV